MKAFRAPSRSALAIRNTKRPARWRSPAISSTSSASSAGPRAAMAAVGERRSTARAKALRSIAGWRLC
ncbi:hypothetical protein VH88_10140 [Brevundimonas sp. KM4]|nr:hypothetical protein VH88_10140 [Brevundimonas sp. KM4]